MQLLEADALERHGARDQVRVELERSRTGDQLFEIAAQQRLAAGQVELNHTECFRLPEDAQPGGSVELVAVPGPVDRVRAVAAAQRAAVRELRDERVGTHFATPASVRARRA